MFAIESTPRDKETIYLPLYSPLSGEVQEKSGLNQWNARGRLRDPNEVYIVVPKWIHKRYQNFFSDRDQIFTLVLPDKNNLQAKICQDAGKALMSNPNKDLGKWILRKVLQLKEGELVTYQKLEALGIDSVRIDKID
ncbi:MAG: hypothetical protein ACRC4W_09345, partial [Treponemataceae bacterium]